MAVMWHLWDNLPAGWAKFEKRKRLIFSVDFQALNYYMKMKILLESVPVTGGLINMEILNLILTKVWTFMPKQLFLARGPGAA